MKSKLLSREPIRTYCLAFAEGDDVLPLLKNFAKSEELSASQFHGIGAFSTITLGFFDLQSREYEETRIDEQVELLSLLGNIALHENAPKLHAHVVVGKRDGSAHGGHLLAASVRPTLELILEESPAHLRRTIDPKTGLPLLHL